MILEANRVMAGASMSLAKWCSISGEVADLLCREFENKYVDSNSVKVLGMRWLAGKDCFSFDGIRDSCGLIVTKRVVLSLMAQLFDPLGLLTPYTMLAKCLFQELWKLGLDWDEEVPEATYQQFTRWLEGMQVLRNGEIDRSYTRQPWSDNSEIQLHAFGDASQKGYGTCVYLVVRLRDGSWVSSLVTARARVAPLKRVTLPRLELLAAELCARLVVFVKRALQLPQDELHLLDRLHHCVSLD